MGLSQSQVAKILDTRKQYVYTWENDYNKPTVSMYPKIIEFLGYFPFEIDTETVGGRIKKYRYLHGFSQEKMALFLNVDEGTIRSRELEKEQSQYLKRMVNLNL